MAAEHESVRLSLSEERLLRLLAEFKVELLRDLDLRFKDVATTVALAALEARTGESLNSIQLVSGDHERRLQTLEQAEAADTALATFRRWAVPVGLGALIAVAQRISIG